MPKLPEVDTAETAVAGDRVLGRASGNDRLLKVGQTGGLALQDQVNAKLGPEDVAAVAISGSADDVLHTPAMPGLTPVSVASALLGRTADITVNIPTDFPTLQQAVDSLSAVPVRQGVRIILNIETGHALTAGLVVENGDYSRFLLTSADPEVPLAAGWVSGTPVAQGINAQMPEWGIVVDCGGKDTGSQALIVSTNSSLQILDGKGLRNAGASGLFVYRNSRATGDQAVFTGCGAYNVWITHLSHGYLERGNFTGSTGAEGNVFVSRTSTLYAVGANFSDSVGPGLTIRRSWVDIHPFGGANVLFDNNGGNAILASDHSTVIAHARTGNVVAFSNCGANFVEIINGSHADLRGATFNTGPSKAINVENGGQVVIDNAVTFTAIAGSNTSQVENILTGNGIIYNGDAADLSYHAQNILGTVSQASGVPTGAIVERGSNANGEYTRFADGTQICFHLVTFTQANTSTLQATWTFPAAFSGNYVVTASVPASTLDRTDVPRGSTTVLEFDVGSTLYLFRAPAGTTPFVATSQLDNVGMMAIGRWF